MKKLTKEGAAVASTAELNRPDIFRYHDYRKFMSDWFTLSKSRQADFSLRSLAKKAQLSCAYLPLVLAGARSLSAKALEKLVPFLGLKTREAQYLNMLRLLSEGETQEARLAAFEQIKKIGSYQQLNPKEIEAYQYLNDWCFVAIREMAAVKGFKADAKWIHARLRGQVTLTQVKNALEFLIQNRFLTVHSDGRVTQKEKDIECVGGVYRLALGRFHSEMLRVSSDVMASSKADERAITGYTMAFPSDKFPEVRKILEEAASRIEALGKQNLPADTVYHTTLMAVPLTKPDKEGKNNA